MATPQLRIAACSYEGSIFGWDCSLDSTDERPASENIELKFGFHASHGSLKAVAVSKSGKYLATAGMNERVHLYNMFENRSIGELSGHTGGITSLQFFEDNILISGSDDGTMYIWRVHDWQHVHILGGHKATVNDFAIHPTGKLAVSVSKDSTVRLWNLVQGRCSFTRKLKTMADSIRWFPSGKYYLIITSMSLQLFDTADNSCKFTISSKSRINQAVFATVSQSTDEVQEDDYRLIYICDNQTLNIANLSGTLIKTINLSSTGIGRLRCVSASASENDSYIVLGTSSGCIAVLDASSLETNFTAEEIAAAKADDATKSTESSPENAEDELIFSHSLRAFHQIKAEPRLVSIVAWQPSNNKTDSQNTKHSKDENSTEKQTEKVKAATHGKRKEVEEIDEIPQEVTSADKKKKKKAVNFEESANKKARK
jgi:protein MAK11